VIHPATVLGDEKSGAIPGNQPIAPLIQQLKHDKMTAMPGTALFTFDVCQHVGKFND
jgi:hypothetical protein